MVVARQRFGKHMFSAMSKHTTTEELLEAKSSMWFMQRLHSEAKHGKYCQSFTRQHGVSTELEQSPLLGAITKQ
jgi:hypothetical protein